MNFSDHLGEGRKRERRSKRYTRFKNWYGSLISIYLDSREKQLLWSTAVNQNRLLHSMRAATTEHQHSTCRNHFASDFAFIRF